MIMREEVISGLEELSELISVMQKEKKIGEAEITEIRDLLNDFCSQKMADSCICSILSSIVTQASDGKFETPLLIELHRQVTERIEGKKAKVIQIQNGSCSKEPCQECAECKKMK